MSVGLGRDRAGKALESYAQTTASSTRVMAVITDRSQTAVDYALALPPGSELVPQPDGSMAVMRAGTGANTGQVAVLGTVAKPWATDASGQDLQTSYAYEAGILTQKVDTASATFPVVVDPQYALGFHIVPVVYTTYNRDETLRLWRQMPYLTVLAPLMCSYFKLKPAVSACAAAIGYDLIRIRAALTYANAGFHRCLKSRLGALPSAINYFVDSYYTVYC